MNSIAILKARVSVLTEQIKPAVRDHRFYLILLGTFTLVLLIRQFTNSIPFSMFNFFFIRWEWGEFLNIPWFLLLVGPIRNLIDCIRTRNTKRENMLILSNFESNIVTSFLAGIFEEISYRWLGFYFAISTFYLSELFTGTRLGMWIYSHLVVSIGITLVLLGIGAVSYINGIESFPSMAVAAVCLVLFVLCAIMVGLAASKQLYTSIIIPIVDWVTQYKLSTQLHEYGWIVGAAVISVNGRFSSGHGYQGFFGLVNSWIGGILLFWFMFNFGLPVAIGIHVLYDVVINSIVGADSFIEMSTATYKRS